MVVHVHRGLVQIGGQRAQKLDVYDANPILDRQNRKGCLLYHTSQTRSVQAALLVRSAVLRNNVQDLGGQVVHILSFFRKNQNTKKMENLNDDPYGCDGSLEVYLGEHYTNIFPKGGQVRKGDAFVDRNTLHITTFDHDHDIFLLKLPLPEQLSGRTVQRLSGRFPSGQGKTLKCQAKVNIQEGHVRVDSFEDMAVWFEVELA